MKKMYWLTFLVEAEPMTLGDFIARNGYNPYEAKEECDPEEEGYSIMFEDGCIYWMPLNVVNRASNNFIIKKHEVQD